MKLICILPIIFLSAAANAGLIANVNYVHNYISAKTGVAIAKSAAADGSSPAYVKYLLAVIDKLNETSIYSAATDYKNHALATKVAIPVNNVWDAANRLFNCHAAGAYKTGAINQADGAGSIACAACTQNYYCTADTNDRMACDANFTTIGTGATAATDCTRACATTDISGSYAVSGTINQTQTPSTACTLTSCAAQYYKDGNACTSCATSCTTSQQCTPTAVSPVASYTANSGTQTRSAACTNAAGNTSTSATCASFGTCTGGTIATCVSEYKLSGNACVPSVISSGTNPISCLSYTNASFVNENSVSGCSGGSAGGSSVSTFVVGAYCSATNGIGGYESPTIQSCANCTRASSQAGQYCYCKIHSINGIAVSASSRFVFNRNRDNNASYCAKDCAYYCANNAQSYSGFRSALFSALGS